jgi:hypothetical protein
MPGWKIGDTAYERGASGRKGVVRSFKGAGAVREVGVEWVGAGGVGAGHVEFVGNRSISHQPPSPSNDRRKWPGRARRATLTHASGRRENQSGAGCGGSGSNARAE